MSLLACLAALHWQGAICERHVMITYLNGWHMPPELGQRAETAHLSTELAVGGVHTSPVAATDASGGEPMLRQLTRMACAWRGWSVSHESCVRVFLRACRQVRTWTLATAGPWTPVSSEVRPPRPPARLQAAVWVSMHDSQPAYG